MSRLGRFAIFIDGPSLFQAVRDLGLFVDYRRLLDYFNRQGDILRATYYTVLLPSTPAWQNRLMDWLAYNGFHVVTRAARLSRQRVIGDDGSTNWTVQVRGNIEIEMAVDMLTLAPRCDTVILFTGSAEFQYVVGAVQRQGCRVVVVSSKQTPERVVDYELMRCADEFIDLASISEEVSRPDRE